MADVMLRRSKTHHRFSMFLFPAEEPRIYKLFLSFFIVVVSHSYSDFDCNPRSPIIGQCP
jgi:hypothetical protein